MVWMMVMASSRQTLMGLGLRAAAMWTPLPRMLWTLPSCRLLPFGLREVSLLLTTMWSPSLAPWLTAVLA